jgi:hypothetical protein
MIHRPLPLHDRLDWAELKLARLDEAVETFLQDQAVTTVSKPNADATEYVISVEKGIDSIPFDIGMMIGEVAHHARSTLDWLAWSIARNPCNDTTFPIWTSPSIDKNGKLIQPFVAGGLAKDAKRLVKLLQPYVAWKAEPTASPLYWLRELDNIDKHRHIVATACADGGYLRQLSTSVRGTLTSERFRSELKPGKPIARVTCSEPNPDLEFDYQPILYIGVSDVAPSLDELNIVGELRYAMVQHVRRIVLAFAKTGLLRR